MAELQNQQAQHVQGRLGMAAGSITLRGSEQAKQTRRRVLQVNCDHLVQQMGSVDGHRGARPAWNPETRGSCSCSSMLTVRHGLGCCSPEKILKCTASLGAQQAAAAELYDAKAREAKLQRMVRGGSSRSFVN